VPFQKPPTEISLKEKVILIWVNDSPTDTITKEQKVIFGKLFLSVICFSAFKDY
jgi:hypothetical protein